MGRRPSLDDYLGKNRPASVLPFTGGHHDSYKKGTIGKCADSHPALKLPGSNLVMHGGSCISPVVLDADIYVGFDHGMKFTARHWPWTQGHEILFPIQDMGIPTNPKNFGKLVDWTLEQLEAGKKIHAGCIGGHGRTGLFLSALVRVASGETDAVTYVRENYCKKVVESAQQMDFLGDRFGIKKVHASKSFSGSKKSYGSSATTTSSGKRAQALTQFSPLSNATSIWRSDKTA